LVVESKTNLIRPMHDTLGHNFGHILWVFLTRFGHRDHDGRNWWHMSEQNVTELCIVWCNTIRRYLLWIFVVLGKYIILDSGRF
jgi:hypothetical protein